MNSDLPIEVKPQNTEPLIQEQSTQDQLDSFQRKVSSNGPLDTQPEAIDYAVQDATAKMKQIDKELSMCGYSVYKVWISILMVLSVIALILGLIYTFSQKLAMLFLVEVIGCAWNTRQLHEQYQAIEDKNMNKANKAMTSFKAFIVVIPILYLLAGVIDNLDSRKLMIGFFGIIIGFYILVVFGARRVKSKLEYRELLKMKVEGTFIEV